MNAKKVFTEAAKILFQQHNKYRTRARNVNLNDNASINSYNSVPNKLVHVGQNRNKGCC